MNVEMYFEGYLYNGKAGFACRLCLWFVFGGFSLGFIIWGLLVDCI